ncbi:MAG: hypothetical protein HY327_04275 [Chloroflexi bacterium]|nr:hypothetical protein [Chloroflexota bacterium]
MFIATDDPKKRSETSGLEYRSLVSYGRQVFQVCVATILTGASIADQLRLASLLVTNQQRLERICQALSKREGTSVERIRETSEDVQDIDTYRFVAEKGLKIEQLIGASKLMIQQYLDSAPSEAPDLIKRMQEFVELDSREHYKILALLKELQNSINAGSSVPPPSPANIHSIVASLIDSVWHYTFEYYYQLERVQKDKANGGAV